MEIPANLDLLYSRTARTDWRIWLMLAVGLLFTWLSFQTDPQLNCDDSGNCNSWVVYIARALGSLATLSGIALLLGNHPRGSGIDAHNGELVWWYGRANGLHRHPLSDISRIRVDLGSDSDDIHLYDRAGERIGFTGTEVIPWPYQDWAARVVERFPHINLDVRN
jgi:hypothetical protein